MRSATHSRSSVCGCEHWRNSWTPGRSTGSKICGVRPGWRCLEVGAGGGSIAAWLADCVGSEGAVVATDLDTTHLRGLSLPNLEIRVHELVVFKPGASEHHFQPDLSGLERRTSEDAKQAEPTARPLCP